MPAWVKLLFRVVLNWLLKELKEELQQGIVIKYKGYKIRIVLEQTREENPDQTILLLL